MSERQVSPSQARPSSAGQQESAQANGGSPSAAAQRQLAEQVAARVYELLCRDLRLERERRGPPS